jgi:uncharacterized protein YaeQ
MAQNATVFKAELQIADVDRGYYSDHALTIARHPSETDERMMVRLLAFALYADDALQFGKGISTDDEPALWHKDLTGAVDRWIEVGLPDERDLRRACGRARHVVVLAYGRTADAWWQQNSAGLGRLANLTVLSLPVAESRSLAALASRTMQLHATIQDGTILITTGTDALHVTPRVLQRAHGDTVPGGG